MNDLFQKIDMKVREKYPRVRYGEIWDMLWNETAKFLARNLDETEISQLNIQLNEKRLFKAIDTIEFGRLRLTERLNYLLDIFK